MQTGLLNFGRAVLHVVIVFIATYGGALAMGIPANIGSITLISLVAGIVSWAQHSIATPSGSTVIHPSKF